MDWRFVDDEKWAEVHNTLNGAAVESMRVKWDEMFWEKEGKERPKTPVKKRTTRKKVDEKKPYPSFIKFVLVAKLDSVNIT